MRKLKHKEYRRLAQDHTSVSHSVVSDSLLPHGLQPARLLCGSLGVLRITERAAREFWEISPGISLKGMRLKLKLQYFGHLMRRVDSLEKTLMVGGIVGRRRRG